MTLPDDHSEPALIDADRDESSEPTFTFDADGRLAEDLACRHCGYNLRGLPADGTCPECETAVGRSIHGDLLRFCDPDWVDRLASGMRLWVISIIAGLIFAFVAVIIVSASLFGTGGVRAPVLIIVMGGFTVIMAIKLYAIWQITSRDPGSADSEQSLTPRGIARGCLVGATVTAGVVGMIDAIGLGGMANMTTPTSANALYLLLAGAAAVLDLVGMAFLFLYARRLALRLPDDALARTTRIVMWGYLIGTAVVQILNLVNKAWPMGTGPAVAQAVMGLAVVVAMIPTLVFWIWSVVLVFKYRNRLRATAAIARRTWAEGA